MSDETDNALLRGLDQELEGLIDPTRTREISFSFSSNDLADAEKLKSIAEGEGFTAAIHKPGGHQTLWVIEVSEQAVLTVEYVRTKWRKWSAVAASLGSITLHGFGYDFADTTSLREAEQAAVEQGLAVEWPPSLEPRDRQPD